MVSLSAAVATARVSCVERESEAMECGPSQGRFGCGEGAVEENPGAGEGRENGARHTSRGVQREESLRSQNRVK